MRPRRGGVRRTGPVTARALGRRAAILATALLFYYGFVIYPLLRLIDWLVPDWRPGTPTLLALLVLPLALRIMASLFPLDILE